SWWRWGYIVFVVLTAACAIALRRSGRILAPAQRSTQTVAQPADLVQTSPPQRGINVSERLRWVLLAFVPSSLMLSVTTYLTTDIAAVPLLWVLPLSLYLLTFVLSFGRRPLPRTVFVRWMPLIVLSVVVVMLTEATEPLVVVVGLHLLLLFWIGMVCHGTLAARRPPAAQLTEFYFLLSVGGVLGGLFNSLFAPVAFNAVTEYPLILVLACILMPAADEKAAPAAARASPNLLDLMLPAGLAVLVCGLIFLRSALVHHFDLGK